MNRRIQQPQSVDVEGVRRLDVRLVGGRLDVVGGEVDDLGRARVEVSSVDGPLEVEVVDGTLRIAHERSVGGGILDWMSGLRRANAVVSVSVPRDTDVSVRLVTADGLVSGIAGTDATVRSVSGNLTIDGVSARISARTVSGDLQTRGVAGDLSLRTVSGDLTVAGGRSGRVGAESVSGDVTLDLDLEDGADVRVKTVSGALRMRVPPDTGLALDVRSVSGSLEAAFDGVLVQTAPGKRTLSGRIGSGQGSLQAKSVSGDVVIVPRAVLP